ncbi:MAG: TetR/AcrR family transcriptional regulator [Desulfobacter sp.]|nr:MAG: TetR/AcrR family transcriptional regulator [Desulfobacter sp.]
MKKTPLAKLKEKEKKARQKLIVDAAERLFSAKPFPKVSMRDIADESGISLSSIYRYFPDQESLFLEALVRGAKKAEARLKSLTGEADTGVREIGRTFVEFLIDNDPYFRMMTHFMLDGVLNKESVEKLNRIERALLDQFNGFFNILNPQGSHRMLSHAFFAALNGILITYRNYPGRDVDDVHKHMLQLADIMAGLFETAVHSGAPAGETAQ